MADPALATPPAAAASSPAPQATGPAPTSDKVLNTETSVSTSSQIRSEQLRTSAAPSIMPPASTATPAPGAPTPSTVTPPVTPAAVNGPTPAPVASPGTAATTDSRSTETKSAGLLDKPTRSLAELADYKGPYRESAMAAFFWGSRKGVRDVPSSKISDFISTEATLREAIEKTPNAHVRALGEAKASFLSFDAKNPENNIMKITGKVEGRTWIRQVAISPSGALYTHGKNTPGDARSFEYMSRNADGSVSLCADIAALTEALNDPSARTMQIGNEKPVKLTHPKGT